MNRPRVTGWILVILGIAQMFYAGQSDVTAPTDPTIANTDLMLQRELWFNGGGFAFLAGITTLAAERICRAISAPKAAS